MAAGKLATMKVLTLSRKIVITICFYQLGHAVMVTIPIYEVRVCRSESICNHITIKRVTPMTSRQNIGTPVVRGNDHFAGVGHNSIIKDDAGDYWIVYHGFDKQEDPYYGTTNRRALLIDKLEWDSEGWPSVATLGASRGATRPYIEPRS